MITGGFHFAATICAHAGYSLPWIGSSLVPLSVMIVEKEALIALDLQDILEGAGHKVVGHATTLAEALKLAKKGGPRVALIDMQLADGANGLIFATALFDQSGVLPLFITGSNEFMVRAMALPVEPLGYISKPYRPDEILSALDMVI